MIVQVLRKRRRSVVYAVSLIYPHGHQLPGPDQHVRCRPQQVMKPDSSAATMESGFSAHFQSYGLMQIPYGWLFIERSVLVMPIRPPYSTLFLFHTVFMGLGPKSFASSSASEWLLGAAEAPAFLPPNTASLPPGSRLTKGMTAMSISTRPAEFIDWHFVKRYFHFGF